MALTTNFIQKFERVTRYPLTQVLFVYTDFVETTYPFIVDYYSGFTDNLDTKAFEYLDRLLFEFRRIVGLCGENKLSFESLEDWDNFEYLEEVRTKLLTIKNTPKYVKSSKLPNVFSNRATFEYVQKQHQTLERIMSDVLNSDDSDNEWANLAVQNTLLESDYISDGGKSLLVSTAVNTPNVKLDSVIDIMIGKNFYGKDFDKVFSFVDDDIKVLGGEETIIQSAEIKTSIKRGDIAEFSTLGIDANLFLGSNVGVFAYSALIRQLQGLFLLDDTFLNFKVKNVKRYEDGIFVEYEIGSFYEFFQNKSVII